MPYADHVRCVLVGLLAGCSLQVGQDDPDPPTVLDLSLLADATPDGPGTLT